MDKLRNRYIKLARYTNIVRNIALVSLILSSVTYMLHLVINNKVSTVIFTLTFLFFTVQLIVYKVIDIIMLTIATKIDKELENKRD